MLACIVLFFWIHAHSFDAIINLGGDCQVAYQLYIHGLRKYALPFDTLITPYDSLKKLLLAHFEDFMMKENFELNINEKGEKYILDKTYGVRLLHDFPLEEDFLRNYEEIAAKYLRRITRFFEIIEASEHPLFIRKNITKEQAAELSVMLFAMRAGKPFLLVALDDAQEIALDWQLERVRNYYLRQPEPYTWKGDPKAWKEIFQKLEFEITNEHDSSDER